MAQFDISITSHCNAACPSCKRYPDYGSYIVSPDQKLHHNLNQTHMDFDVFKNVIEKNINNFKRKRVSYEGELGDPLTHPHVKKFIDYGCEIFSDLLIVTNGGNRTPQFYKSLGDRHRNLAMCFSIDGMHDDTNQIYRRKVITKKAFENMLAFSNSKYGYRRTYWQFLVFEHNFFEIPEVLNFAKENKITVYVKINRRPKFLISKKRELIAKNLYEKHKFLNKRKPYEKSIFMFAN